MVLWSCDNREGSVPFSEEISVTTGIKLTSTESISFTVGLETSLKSSVSLTGVSEDIESKLSLQIDSSLSQTEEKNWSRTSKITFTAPIGKNYRVKQLSCEFVSPLSSDNCVLTCHYVIEESNHDFNED